MHRQLSEAARTAYQELRERRERNDTPGGMREYVDSLNGALSEEEHRALERWIVAEECEPPVRRRWRVITTR